MIARTKQISKDITVAYDSEGNEVRVWTPSNRIVFRPVYGKGNKIYLDSSLIGFYFDSNDTLTLKLYNDIYYIPKCFKSNVNAIIRRVYIRMLEYKLKELTNKYEVL